MMQATLVEAITQAARCVLPDVSKPIPLHEPIFSTNETQLVQECLETGWVSYAGRFVRDFDEALQKQFNVAAAVCMVSGTAALHMALLVAGVQPDDEVLVPALTFVASANAIRHCGAIPHFVDSHSRDLGIHVEKLREYLKQETKLVDGICRNVKTGRRISAMMPVHVLGHPSDLDALIDVAHAHRLILIEDAAESLGSLYKNKATGSYGMVSATSFNGNKIITTGGGGALLTNDLALAERARHLSTTAKKTHAWEFYHDAVGYNYRLPNINAALGFAQLKRIDETIARKRELAVRYQSAFSSMTEVSFFEEPPNTRSNYWLNAIVLSETTKSLKETVITALHQCGILARGLWTPMHLLPMYSEMPRMDLSVTMDLYERVINLPSSPQLVST